MEFDLQGDDAKSAYKLLAGLVTPRPIAWVTTQDDEGRVNAAPFSFFNVFGTRPPIVAFAPGDKAPGIPKDTAKNIRAGGELLREGDLLYLPPGESSLQHMDVGRTQGI